MTTAESATSGPRSVGTRTPVRAAVASLLGSALEYYEYMLYAATATLVFPHVFFPAVDPTSAVLLSFATYRTRPR